MLTYCKIKILFEIAGMQHFAPNCASADPNEEVKEITWQEFDTVHPYVAQTAAQLAGQSVASYISAGILKVVRPQELFIRLSQIVL